MLAFDRDGATAINQARLDHLASLDLDLQGKTVLEPGAGIGLLTHFFEKQGCAVTSTEGRESNVAENLRRHPWRAGRISCVDLETPGSHDRLDRFDVVFLYGTLYHVRDPRRVLEDLARVCTSLFLLETQVHYADDGTLHHCGDSDEITQALHRKGCRPARDWMLSELHEVMGHAYLAVKQANHPDFPTRWPSSGNRVRAVFVGSRSPLDLPTLSGVLLNEQERL